MRDKKIPFSIDRSDWRSLVEQLKDGLRQAIVSGYYSPGDTLPSYRELAPLLDVSEIVTKAAIKQLADEGLVTARPRIGTVVRDLGEKRWKGRVLIVHRNKGCGYYPNVFESVLSGLLAKDGWLCLSASISGSSGGRIADISEIKAMAASPVNLAIVLFDNPAAEKFLSESGIPFVVLGGRKTCRLRGCKGCLRYDRAAQGGRFADACLAEGVKTVVQVGIIDFDDVEPALRKAGVACRSWLLDGPPPDQPSDVCAELARDAFIDYLKSGKPLPDVFYFFDDYLCAGALAALSDAGIRAPQDVRIATWANHGNVPIYARELSRIELNPWKDAEDTHAFCRDILSGKNPGKPPVLAPVWIEGETFTVKCKNQTKGTV